MRKIFRYSHFSNPENKHGGFQRSEQLREILQQHEYELVEIPYDLSTKANPLKAVPSGLRLARDFRLHIKPSYAALLANRVQAVGAFLRKHKDVGRVVLIEAPHDYPVALAALQQGCQLLTLPQNFEAFCSKTDRMGVAFPESLLNELTIYRASKAVFPISYEEEWLLKLQNIDCLTLPYRPVEEHKRLLAFLRQKRVETAREEAAYLMLGSAVNAFSRAGMEEIIAWLSPALKAGKASLDVAGFGTEKLAETTSDMTNLRLHGSVTNEKRDALMIGCRALLVHQKAGAGALTRIVEALYAGVPVIANRTAARSAHYPGVLKYDHRGELMQLIEGELPELPKEACPPIDYPVSRLIEAIRESLQ